MINENFFTRKEMECPCCGACHMDDDFMLTLNHARRLYGLAIHPNSGFRCDKHNKELGSTSTNHTSGKAIDAWCTHPTKRFTLVKCFMLAGMTGIGIHDDYIHGDTNHDIPALWSYQQKLIS